MSERIRTLLPCLLSTLLIAACDSTDPPPPPAQLHAVEAVTMGTGLTRPLISATDRSGDSVSLRGVTLRSSNTAVATISPAGVLTTAALGNATITAEYGALRVQTRVYVVPATVNACETNTATLCSTWTLADSLYNARWQQGSQAVIRVGYFGADSVRFERVDPAGTSTGTRAVYRGPVTSRTAAGTVVWTLADGFTFSGAWNGSW